MSKYQKGCHFISTPSIFLICVKKAKSKRALQKNKKGKRELEDSDKKSEQMQPLEQNTSLWNVVHKIVLVGHDSIGLQGVELYLMTDIFQVQVYSKNKS